MPLERAPARNGDLPVLGDNEEIRFSQPRVRLYAGQQLEGEGTLHLTTKQIVWLNTQNPAAGYAMDYWFVVMHAVSRDKSAWPEPCLYCQLQSEDKGEVDEDEAAETPELRFVPADPASLQQMFMVFSEMSAMNPDPNDDQAEDLSDDDEDSADDQPLPFQLGPPPGGNVWSADYDDAAMEDADEEGDITMETDTK
mmetsp:Transcript_24408/g.53052  ORF Transcript_24408/g.53052 Transcript_24408/m.53052 type:complete len:196 (+) Transcript_24408:101-688(+)